MERQVHRLDSAGNIRQSTKTEVLARVQIPETVYHQSRRELLTVAGQPDGRLAVVVTELVRGRLPACTQLLLYGP